ncbi:MAG: hypothetical protein ACRD82_23685, partial [Blastocatellia bacterium]
MGTQASLPAMRAQRDYNWVTNTRLQAPTLPVVWFEQTTGSYGRYWHTNQVGRKAKGKYQKAKVWR